ncbi:MAG TPA: 16S rRNA (uracil(1498)-N(3))-methyltransferase [Pyrinomonadaceae bacterium]|nr:16S rRNA (uracil(1498)-N(3))-methyltransferase [Pyrinomonadaceae bacterium]
MTRRRFYAPPEAFSPDGRSVQLSDEETRHLRNVLRLKAGDEIFVFDGAGKEFQGRVQAVARDSTEASVIKQVDPAQPESSLDLILAIALLKGEKFDLVIQKATELGVTRIIPVITARADVRIKSDADAERKITRCERIALEATKQCGRARLMKIEKPVRFSGLVRGGETDSSAGGDDASEDACAPVKNSDVRIMFAERQGASLAEALGDGHNRPQNVTALIGPEGGWADDEIDQASIAGWKIVTLGGRTLRAETAAIVAATLIQHRFGDLT